MSFYVEGMNPRNNKGETFHRNAWWWRLLWDFTCQICPDLTEEDAEGGHANGGYEITEPKAQAIAESIRQAIECGDAKYFEASIKAASDLDYAFSVDNAQEFADFAEASGGFMIY